MKVSLYANSSPELHTQSFLHLSFAILVIYKIFFLVYKKITVFTHLIDWLIDFVFTHFKLIFPCPYFIGSDGYSGKEYNRLSL